ncbi:uncharacterized protein LOC134713842 [Mytilus trossulus]|uniref:uncharacterized protein LOC134713842 n=1 Tax=Mytilus trossulus TaxID=6551 RepID=UPI0030073FC4
MVLSPPKKKKRVASCKYLEKWENDVKYRGWLSKSTLGLSHAFCKVCNRDFKVDHGGLNDVSKHAGTAIHQKSFNAQNITRPVTNFFVGPQDEGTIKAEVIWSNFIAQHNISFLLADCFTKVCKAMFTDSKIALKFACSRTKTTQIIKKSLAPTLHQEVVRDLQTKPFSMAIDESNDRNCDKSLAILVRYFTDQATTKFLAMPICNIGKASKHL